jgi:hypothetical protein
MSDSLGDEHPKLPESYEEYGAIHDPHLVEDGLPIVDEELDDVEVTKHICRTEDGEPLCGASVDPGAEVYPFRGKRSQIRAGLESCCQACVDEFAKAGCDSSPTRLALVGCGKKKREVTGHPNYADNHYRAAVLYTSVYFALKREYAERMCEYWYILSAKHALYHPFCIMKPYDVQLTRSGFAGDDEPAFDSVDAWADAVLEQLQEKLEYLANSSGNDAVDEVVVLAGQAYVEPLRDGLDALDVSVRYPFDRTSGIGEQMGWLNESTDETEPVGPRYQAVVQGGESA